MKKSILTEEKVKHIIQKYTNDNIGIESLCNEYKVGKLKIKDILIKNNIPLKKKGAQIKHNKTNKILNTKIIKYENTDLILENKI
jgi:hypothetical protein